MGIQHPDLGTLIREFNTAYAEGASAVARFREKHGLVKPTEIAHGDYETRGVVELRKSGVHVYALHKDTDAWCLDFAFDDEAVEEWVNWPLLNRDELALYLGKPDAERAPLGPSVHQYLESGARPPLPERLVMHIISGGEFHGHNVGFEWHVWNLICVPRYGWPALPIEQCYCTAAMAAAMSMPRSLEDVAIALRLQEQKDKAGSRVMMQLAKPRRVEADGTLVWWTDPAKHATLHSYCKQDVVVEREVEKKLRPLSPMERRVWLLDFKINQRGVRVDLPLVKAAQRVVKRATERLNFQMGKVTDGQVTACTQAGALVGWLGALGVPAESVAKDQLLELLDRKDLPDKARKALLLRQEAAKASTAKLTAMQNSVSPDGRVRGMFLYHGAGTGRWSGRNVQLQNLPRGTVKYDWQQQLIPSMYRGDLDTLGLICSSPMQAVSDLIRLMLVPDPGKDFLVADFSAIEARGLAFLAGEEKVLEVFRKGEDIYLATAAGIYSRSITKADSAERQVGKCACVAEGGLILTDRGPVPIESVSTEDRVWDGVEWVNHDGVVFQGVQDVFDYQSVRLTREHLVWTDEHEDPIPFEQAAHERATLRRPDLGRSAPRERDGDAALSLEGPRIVSVFRGDEVLDMREGGVDSLPEPSGRGEPGLRPMLPTTSEAPQQVRSPPLAATASACNAHAVLAPGQQVMASLRRQGDRVQIPVPLGVCEVGRGQSWAGSESGPRQDRQQRALRAGEPEIRHQIREFQKSVQVEDTDGRGIVGRIAQPVRPKNNDELSAQGVLQGGDHRDGLRSGSPQAEALAGNLRPAGRARTYDLLNAGPRHRFTVNGVLVHNCLALGYQGGVGAFQNMAKIYNVKMDGAFPTLWGNASQEDRDKAKNAYETRGKAKTAGKITEEAWLASELTKIAWRRDNPNIVQFWKDLENAAVGAVANPGTVTQAGKYIKFRKDGPFLWCRLPSGRALCYPFPKLVAMAWVELLDGTATTMSVEVLERASRVVGGLAGLGVAKVKGEARPSLTFKFWEKGHWATGHYYGGHGAENCLAGDTEVLTRRGWCRITSVSGEDTLWDGEEWVRHDGLVQKGLKDVGDLNGVRLTHDHLVLKTWQILPAGQPVKEEWVPARQMLGYRPLGFVTDVYDLKNAGPRHRFTVRAPFSGIPFIVHNCTQAACRDLLSEALLRLEDRGYPVVLHVHDEAGAEVPLGDHSLVEFEAIMAEVPEWAPGFPIAAEGYRATRYHK